MGASEKIFAAGMTEWRRSHRVDGGLIAGAQSRIDRSMDVAISKEAEELQSGLSVLATGRVHCALCWLVRHGLGYHERLYRNRRSAKH